MYHILLIYQYYRAPAAMRTAAMSCLWALLQSGLAMYEQLADILDEILTKVRCLLTYDHN